ncbi:MAG: DNA recombination protein RmuC [bacterium]|nr:DNA recombination protein RmuC [bacterium]
MNILIVSTIILSAILILFIIRLWLNKFEKNSKLSEELIQWLKNSTSSTDQKLSQNMKIFNDRLDSTARVIGDVQKNIGEFSEIGRSMKDLQEFLQSPKLRGNIGEQILNDLLAQHFPKDTYELQHTFKNGEKVDAIIKTSQGLIPIDSKFPMENFRKMIKETDPILHEKATKDFVNDVKKHIQDISRKYILTSEGTMDYALMYIPSESIYYEIINNADLFDFSGQKRVLPISPMSFYAYMKAILMSFEGQRIQSQAKEILKLLHAIKKDYEKSDESLLVLNKHITNAYNQTAQVSKNFSSLGQKLTTTHLLSEKEKDSLPK